MANVPQPRSYQQILGSMLSSVMSNLGLASVKVGGPLLTVLEAASQSDFRSSEDTFNALQSSSLETAQGDALDNIGAQEKTPRPGPTFASGIATFTDTNFDKIFSKVYPGTPAVSVGTTSLNVSNATGFPPTGSIYIGRGTPNLEGPLAYTAITAQVGASGFTNYYVFTLTAPTQFFHNVNETVILSQGGVRPIGAGTVIAVPQGTNPQVTNYSTLYPAYIPDGETFVANVAIVCQIPGSIGNASAGNITQIVTPLFNGCTVTNPTPLSNAQDAYNDVEYRELIRQARQTRAKGTNLALTTGVIGVTSPTENKTIVSANLVANNSGTNTLYVDDGTGYEEVDQGISFEAVINPALGGENTFHLASQPPVAKAELFSATEPFALSAGAVLSATVGGITTEHTFQVSSFNSISNATAFEVVSSINSDPNIYFSARTANNGSQVVLFAIQDTNESIQVVSSLGNDANLALQFPTTLAETLRLYKNDVLLYKDGFTANVTTNTLGTWSNSIGSTGEETLIIAIDGTPAQTYTFTSTDFVNGNTGYSGVGRNSLAAWVIVFNNKIPGITAQISGGAINIISNSGTSSKSSIVINANSSLVINSMFNYSDLSSTGFADNYTLDRNTGELQLATNLVEGDILTAGSFNTEGYLGGTPAGSNTVYSISLSNQVGPPAIPGPYWWVAVDGGTTIVPISGVTTLTVTQPYGYLQQGVLNTPFLNGNPSIRLTSPNVGTFANVLPGDWMIAWDTGLTNPANGPTFLSGTQTTVNGAQSYTSATTSVLLTSTAGLPTSGTVYIQTVNIVLAVPYTGVSGNNITGTAGVMFTTSGTLTAGAIVNGSSTLGLPGAFRISAIDPINSSYVEFKSPYVIDYTGTNSVSLSTQQGLVFCRTSSEVQTIAIPPTTTGNNYTFDTLASAFNNILIGAFAVNYNNTTLRIATDTTYTNGDIMIITANQIAQAGITFPLGQRVESSPPHLPYIESQDSTLNTPGFLWDYVIAGDPLLGNGQFTTALHSIKANSEIAFLKSFESPFIAGSWTSTGGTATITATVSGAFNNYVTGQYINVYARDVVNTYSFLGPITKVSGSSITVPSTLTASGISVYVQNYIAPMDISSMSNNGILTTVTVGGALTTINGNQSLPESTITVNSTAGFASSGSLYIQATNAKIQLVTYTGISGNTFTGCLGGTGTISNGNTVYGSIAHGLSNGQSVRIFKATNSLYDGTFTDITVTGPGTFTYAQTQLGGIPTINQMGPGVAIGMYLANGAYSTDSGDSVQNATAAGQTVTPRFDNSLIPPTTFDRLFTANPYSISPRDNLALVLDGSSSKNFNINLYRNVGPVLNTLYGQTLDLIDLDNSIAPGSASSSAFGTTFNFDDYALYMNGRGISHSPSYVVPSTSTSYYNKGAIWRYQRMGPEGSNVTIQYVYPASPNQPVGLTTVNTTNGLINLDIILPSGSAVASTNVTNSTNFAISPSATSGTLSTLTVSGTNGVITMSSSNMPDFIAGDVLYLTGVNGTTSGINGNSFPVTSSSNAIVSSGYVQTINFTVPAGTTASGVSTGTVERGTSTTNSSSMTFIAGMDLPVGGLTTPSYTISSISGNGTTTTVTISAPAFSSVSATAAISGFTSLTIGYWNITNSGTSVGNAGTVLFGGHSTAQASPTSYVKLAGTGVAGWDGNTFQITSISASSPSLVVTFASSVNTSSSTGTIQPNTVLVAPTLPIGNVYNLQNTYLSPATNGQFITIQPNNGSSIDSNYPAGTKYVFGLSNLTFGYIDTSTTPAAASSAAAYAAVVQSLNSFVSYNNPVISGAYAPISLANVSVGNLVRISPNLVNTNGWSSSAVGTFRVRAVGNQWFEVIEPGGGVSSALGPQPIVSPSNITFYPLSLSGSAPTVNQITAAINSNSVYGAIVQGTPVADVGDPNGTTAGTGTITYSTLDEYYTGTSNVIAYPFFDGVNYIASDNLSATPNTFLLKNTVSSVLTSTLGNNLDNNFNKEVFRLVPITSAGVVNFLNSPATSGLFTNGDALATSDGTKVSLSSLTAGSLGSIQVTGGSSNSVAAPVIGSSILLGNSKVFTTVSSALAQGFVGGEWCELQASSPKPKLTGWTSSTNITITPGPTALTWLDTTNRGITDGLIGGNVAYPVNQIQLTVTPGSTNIVIYLLSIGNAPGSWAVTPQIGDILTIPNSSVIAGSGANQGNWMVVAATGNSITASPLGGQTPTNVGQTFFAHNPPGSSDLNVQTSIYVPAGSALVTVNSGGTAGTMSATNTSPITTVNLEWQIEKHGNFIAYVPTGNGAPPQGGSNFPSNLIPPNNDTTLNTGEGGWVHVYCNGFSAANQGFFQVVRTETDTYTVFTQNNFPVQGFWVYNPNGIKEVVQQTAIEDGQLPADFINFYSYDSIIPGDVFVINTAAFGGVANQGSWSVSQIVEGATMGQTYNQFVISGNGVTNFAAHTANLGTNVGYIQIMPQSALTLYKRILSIGPDAGNLSGLTDIIFDTPNLATRITQTNGFTVSGLDKLNFTPSLVIGQDAYKVATGIISEANKVVYGVANDPVTYPGIASTGTNINIQGPIVKRIQLSVAVRLQANANVDEDTILNNVQSAIASVVNNVGVGGQLALGAVIAAAQGVNGVISAVMLSPVLTSANDLIPIQPFEKPLILNINTDILVTTL